MTKEAPNSSYNKLVFRETFNDEATVRKNGGSNVWYGYIPKLTVVEGILPLTDITREWSSTRREIL
jgi:hypothetical protein